MEFGTNVMPSETTQTQSLLSCCNQQQHRTDRANFELGKSLYIEDSELVYDNRAEVPKMWGVPPSQGSRVVLWGWGGYLYKKLFHTKYGETFLKLFPWFG
jgi:hypothetical protein